MSHVCSCLGKITYYLLMLLRYDKGSKVKYYWSGWMESKGIQGVHLLWLKPIYYMSSIGATSAVVGNRISSHWGFDSTADHLQQLPMASMTSRYQKYHHYTSVTLLSSFHFLILSLVLLTDISQLELHMNNLNINLVLLFKSNYYIYK